MPKPEMIVYNNLIPFKGFCAINLFGVIFARKKYKPLPEKVIRHEEIHTAQMRELLYVGFYILYFLEWLGRLCEDNAYRNISFEREAYVNQNDANYLENRPKYHWRKYM